MLDGARRILLAIALGFLCELSLDLAHLGQLEHAADPGRVDSILGREHDGDEDASRGDKGDGSGTQELRRGRQFRAGRNIGVVHGFEPQTCEMK